MSQLFETILSSVLVHSFNVNEVKLKDHASLSQYLEPSPNGAIISYLVVFLYAKQLVLDYQDSSDNKPSLRLIFYQRSVYIA